MKNINQIIILTISFLMFLELSCVKKYGYSINNQSKNIVSSYIANGDIPHKTYYGDSLPKTNDHFIILKPNEGVFIEHLTNLEEQFAKLPKDTLSVYFFSVDTLNAYPWNTIRRENKYLKKFDLSLSDIRRMGLKIDYK